MKILLLTLIAVFPILAQNKFDFNTQSVIKLFADYLFCEKDYFRAAGEYNRLTGINCTDTVIFKKGLCYYYIGDLKTSKQYLDEISSNSNYFYDAVYQKCRISFLENSPGFYSVYQYDQNSQNAGNLQNNVYKLAMISSLFSDNLKLSEEEFYQPFNPEEKKQLKKYFDWKNNPPYKSPMFAGILSTIIPGSGKFYTEEYGDGILAFLSTGLFSFLAYDNFKASHNTRGWIFTSLAGFFYAGNIYGSIASAQIFNAKIDFEFKNGINLFLEKNNYFSPEYDFCK